MLQIAFGVLDGDAVGDLLGAAADLLHARTARQPAADRVLEAIRVPRRVAALEPLLLGHIPDAQRTWPDVAAADPEHELAQLADVAGIAASQKVFAQRLAQLAVELGAELRDEMP